MFPYHDENETQRPAVVTVTIVVLCVAAWLLVQGGGATMPAVVQGAPLRFLFSTFNRPLFWLYSRPEIKDIKGLKGKKVSVSGIGSGPDTLLRDLLKKNALEPGRDVTILGVGSNPTLLASLQNNVVDASMLSPPFGPTGLTATHRSSTGHPWR